MSAKTFRRKDGELFVRSQEKASETFLCYDGDGVCIVLRRGETQLYVFYSPAQIRSLIGSLQSMIAGADAPAVNPHHAEKCVEGRAEYCADEIKIRETFDGRVGVLLHSAARLMHCPLSPESARHVAGLLVSSADKAEAGKIAPERLN